MARWHTPTETGDVLLYEHERQSFATEAQARAAAEQLGAVLLKERIGAAFYALYFVVTARGYAPGFVLAEATPARPGTVLLRQGRFYCESCQVTRTCVWPVEVEEVRCPTCGELCCAGVGDD